jgi:hypothetical protein
VAGEADGDGTDDAVRRERGTADHDDHGDVRVCLPEFRRDRDQLLCDLALAPVKIKALLAAAKPVGGEGAEFLLDIVEV